MLSQLSVLTYVIGNRPFNLLCAPDASTFEVKEALCQFLKMIGQIEDNAKAQQEQQSSQPEQTEEDPRDDDAT